jgi:hypothetical protein
VGRAACASQTAARGHRNKPGVKLFGRSIRAWPLRQRELVEVFENGGAARVILFLLEHNHARGDRQSPRREILTDLPLLAGLERLGGIYKLLLGGSNGTRGSFESIVVGRRAKSAVGKRLSYSIHRLLQVQQKRLQVGGGDEALYRVLRDKVIRDEGAHELGQLRFVESVEFLRHKAFEKRSAECRFEWVLSRVRSETRMRLSAKRGYGAVSPAG